MNSLADAVASLGLDDSGSLPYGRSHWDRKPAELHAMILKHAGPLTLFINGLLGDTDSLNEATVEALWTDAVSIDWQGDLALLPDINLYADKLSLHERPTLDMFSLPVSRSMYSRLCTRFPDQAACDNFDPQLNHYATNFDPDFDHFEDNRLRHIRMRNGWFDLVDFSYPIGLGWQAIYFGHASLLKHLVAHHDVVLKRFQRLNRRLAMDLAAKNGHLDVLQMLHDAGSRTCSNGAMDQAACNGHLHVVKWLHANRTQGCTTWAMDGAAEEGRLDVVKWLHENRTEGCTTRAMDLAASQGHLHVVKWLHANRTEGCTTQAMDWAAEEGHLDVFIWLLENRTEGCTTSAMDRAAFRGRLDVIKWLHANRTEGCTTWAMGSAAMNGHLDVVQWLHANRTEGCTTEAIDDAARHGHLEVVQWLHANRTEGCTTDAIKGAAEDGHLEVVQFLLTCGYEFTFDALCDAQDEAIVEVLVDSMSLARAMEMLEEAMAQGGRPDVIERLERAVAAKQA